MDTNNFKSWNELSRLYSDEKWRYMSLITVDGEILVPYNNNKVTPENKWKEIKKKLESKLLPEGVYLFKAKNTPGSRGVEDKIFVVKGDLEKMKKEFSSRSLSEAQTKVSIPAREAGPVQITPAVLTWDAALKNMQEISELKIANKLLEEENQKLKEANAELQEELSDTEEEDEGETELPTWAEQLFPIFESLADRYFNLRDKELRQRDAALAYYGVPAVSDGNGTTAPRQAPQQRMTNAEYQFLQYMDGLLDSNDMTKFRAEMEVLKTNNPALHQKISQTLSNAGVDINEEE